MFRVRTITLKRWTFALLAATAVVATAPRASAYNWTGTCEGQPYRLDTATLPETRMACSFPTGTPYYTAYLQAIDAWNRTTTKSVTASYVSNNCEYDDGDWYNDIAMFSPNPLMPNVAYTSYYHVDACAPPFVAGTGYSEADVVIRNDLNYDEPDESWPLYRSVSSRGYGRTVLVHEIGHQLGLGIDYNAFSVENPGTYYPLVGDKRTKPMPDDLNGIGVLYASRAYTNLMVSSTKFVNSTAQPVISGNVQLYVGGSFTSEFTIINQSASAVTFDDRVILQNSSGVYWVLASWSRNTIPGRSYQTWAYTHTYGSPSIPADTYDVRYEVLNISGDSYLEDNNTRLPIKVTIHN